VAASPKGDEREGERVQTEGEHEAATREASGAEMSDIRERDVLHVVPRRDGRWAVRRRNGRRALRTFDSRQDAVRFTAGRYEVLYVHRADGTVESVARRA
jgi:hypothetical protein